MGNGNTLYWHDYETSGTDPRRDRPVQFAGLRTDEDLDEVGKPLKLYCRLAGDVLPHPEACLVTGITPQRTLREGVPEAEFIGRIHTELGRPGTCGVGYNSLRFDDEVTRNTLYRNFFDPYAREWQGGNSRWDIIDMVRLTRALRPEGIEWPNHADGSPSFRLEDLTRANGIGHEAAHDALSDVRATIAMARLVRQRQPRLYDYVYSRRGKRSAFAHLNLSPRKPVLHASSRYPAEYGCTALVVPVARHPVNKNGVIVYDLRHDPGPLLELGSEAIRERLYTPAADLPEGAERIPLKVVHANKCPVLVPVGTLDQAAAERLRIDLAAGQRHLRALEAAPGLAQKVAAVFAHNPFPEETDPDLMLYGGGFFSDADRTRMEQVRACGPQDLAGLRLPFQDPRLPEMLFRYRARNYPETLNGEERSRWEAFRRRRLDSREAGGITLQEYRDRIAALRREPEREQRDLALLDELEAYGETILREP